MTACKTCCTNCTAKPSVPIPGPIRMTSLFAIAVIKSALLRQSTNIASGVRVCSGAKLIKSVATVVNPAPAPTTALAAIKIAPPYWMLPPISKTRPNVPLWLSSGRRTMTSCNISDFNSLIMPFLQFCKCYLIITRQNANLKLSRFHHELSVAFWPLFSKN